MSVIITDIGNDVQFTFSNNHVYTLNKLSLRVKQDDSFVYMTNADGFVQTLDNKVIKLRYNEVTSPVYASNDELLNGVLGMASGVALGSSGGGGGGGSTYTNVNNADFSASPGVGTNQITIGGLGAFTLEAKNVISGSIKKISSSGGVENLSLSSVVVSGGVITLGNEDDFVSGDTVLVSLQGPLKAYDEGADSDIITVLNPDSEKWTSVEHLVDFSSQGAAILRYIIPMEGFKDLSMHRKFSNTDGGDTIAITIWATNNAAADDSIDTNWVDMTGDWLTKTLTITGGTIEFYEEIKDIHPLKVMLRIAVSSAAGTNAADIYIKKKAL